MDLKMNYNSFIKLKDFFKLIDVSAEVDNYDLKDEAIEGMLTLKGKYLKRDNQTSEYFLEKVPFLISIQIDDYEIVDIECVDLEYVSFEGRGIDVSFDILVNYEIIKEVPVITEENVVEAIRIEEEKITNEEFEELKNIETKRVDDLLTATLNFKDDNLPTKEIVIRGLKEPKTSFKICYYQDEKDLEEVCKKNNVSIDTIFKQNQEFEYNKYRRVIINDK